MKCQNATYYERLNNTKLRYVADIDKTYMTELLKICF